MTTPAEIRTLEDRLLRRSERLEGKRLVMDRRARLFTHLGIIFKPDQKAW